jgi:thiamine-phosphate pyrophosphorylase
MITMEREKTNARFYQPIELDFNIYLVTDRRQTGEKTLLEATEDALKGGVRAVQLREKDLGTKDLLRLAYEMRELTLKYDARLFINDRVDIAIAVDADGVHLGQKSIPPFAVRRFAARLIIGMSTHSLAEAQKAQRNGADFITLGPIFHTPAKSKYGEPLGLEVLEKVASEINIPIFAIGGITLENAREAIEHGAAGVSLIRSIYAAKEVKAAALKLFKALK